MLKYSFPEKTPTSLADFEIFLNNIPTFIKPKINICTSLINELLDFCKAERPTAFSGVNGVIIFGTAYGYQTVSIDGRSADFLFLTANTIVKEDLLAFATTVMSSKYYSGIRKDTFEVIIVEMNKP